MSLLKDRALNLETPTSLKMKNTFLLQNTNQSFDEYHANMKKRKIGSPSREGELNHSKITINADGQMYDENDGTVLINFKYPSARDGHSAVMFGDKMIIFGGDRHHMPFNDLFIFDLKDFFFSNQN